MQNTNKNIKLSNINKALNLGISTLAFCLIFTGLYTNTSTHDFANNLLTSVIRGNHAPFDGLVLPVEKIPRYSLISRDARRQDFNTMDPNKLEPLPKYDPSILKIPYSSLSTGSSKHKEYLDVKLTYSVAYCGSYENNSVEYTGSHCAIDIVLMPNTPILAIGNAVVEKVGSQSYGAGNYVVLKHKNFPTMDGKRKETIFSSYSHLNSINVKKGDIIKKGQVIGKSGNTGFSTGPHLHFQIDKSSAPYSPYWPFTYKEITSLNMNFMEAVNNGVGLQNGIKHTIHPMKYIYNYYDSNAFESSSKVKTKTNYVKNFPAGRIHGFLIENKKPVIAGHKTKIFLRPFNKAGDIINVRNLKGKFVLHSKNNAVLKVLDTNMPGTELRRGGLLIDVNPMRIGETQVMVQYKGDNQSYTYQTNKFKVLAEEDYLNFLIVHDANYVTNSPINFYVKVLDHENNLVESPNFAGYVNLSLRDDIGVLSKTKLSKHDFSNGLATIQVQQAYEGRSRITTTYKGKEQHSGEFNILDGSDRIENLLVSAEGDILPGRSNKVTINAVNSKGETASTFQTPKEINVKIVEGNASLSKSNLDLNDFVDGKAEIELTPNASSSVTLEVSGPGIPSATYTVKGPMFTDIKNTDPKYQAIKFLKDNNIVNGYSDGSFKQNNTVTRVEALKMILLANRYIIKEDNTDVPHSSITYFHDTEKKAWYNKYVVYGVKNKVLNGFPDKTFKPHNTINRSELSKVLLKAFDVNVNKEITVKPYKDMSKFDWFAPYAKYFKDNNIIKTKSKFYFLPTKAVSRGELATAIYNTLKTEGFTD